MTAGAVEGAKAIGRVGEIALAAEIDKAVRAVYRDNFPTANVHPQGDVVELFPSALGSRLSDGERMLAKSLGPIELLVGGPPCQGHSNLNNHTRRRDPKNALYSRMVRAAEVLEPHMIVIENVPSVRRDRGDVVKCALERLVGLGYSVADGVVAMSQIGVPQRRFRHLLLATRTHVPSVDHLVATHRRPERSLHWAIADLESVDPEQPFDMAARLSDENLARVRWLHKHDRYDLPNSKRPTCHRGKPDHRYKSMYGRMRYDQPAQTITTGFGSPGQGRYLHPTRLRTLTPHEAARVQFFPDSFTFGRAATRAALAHCIGNAVPPKLGYAIVRYLGSLVAGVELAIQPSDGTPSKSLAEAAE